MSTDQLEALLKQLVEEVRELKQQTKNTQQERYYRRKNENIGYGGDSTGYPGPS